MLLATAAAALLLRLLLFASADFPPDLPTFRSEDPDAMVADGRARRVLAKM